ncbi:hypothetical protein GCM10007881_28030 [Mesorhizobium huakuii]|uniref:hypothetical protein n=1 Tax=Mesorhizobium huakuii TaxID=28104 RepID=UPI00235CF508|nr:hypothetical protein [Mesorhizobium huakuii]GLQ79285.1 hypothetical protein GCM10007881_28030 [Mesorhizobium huakuii]
MKLRSFDNKAHEIIASVLDNAAEHLVQTARCKPTETDEYLTLAYIAECSSVIKNGTSYLEVDEIIGAELFLEHFASGKSRTSFMRNDRKCAKQLAAHPNVYFPDYLTILRLAYLRVLNAADDATSIRANGTLMLAAASLPGVSTDIRRELRRRGLTYELSLVPKDVLQKRLGPNGTLAIAHRMSGRSPSLR